MILPMGAIHFLDRLKFRFVQDYAIDERLLDDFLRTETTEDAVLSVLFHLKSALGALHAMVWKTSENDAYAFLASADETILDPQGSMEPATLATKSRWTRFEPLSKDWVTMQTKLFGRFDERIAAIDILHEPDFALFVAWNGTVPSRNAMESSMTLIQTSFDVDRVPDALRRAVRTPDGKTYYLAPILALYRFHDPDARTHQIQAIALAERLLPSNPELVGRVKTLLWIRDIGAVLTPKSIVVKTKRTREEQELLEEMIVKTEELLFVFHLEALSSQANVLKHPDALFSEETAIALFVWHRTEQRWNALRQKLPRAWIRRFPPSVRELIKQHRIA